MSDIRFIMIGVSLIFAGFLILGIFGSNYSASTLEAKEFGECYEYFEDKPPVPVDCNVKLLDKYLFFGFIIGLIGAGVFSLIKGVKGKWDQDVKPQDMLGPGEDRTKFDSDKKDSK